MPETETNAQHLPLQHGRNVVHVILEMIMRYVWSAALVVLITLAGIYARTILTEVDLALIYLGGLVVIAPKFGYGASFFYSLGSALAYNYFFASPSYQLSLTARSEWMTFVVMMITGFVITNQASRLRTQARFAQKREQDTQTFFTMTRELVATLNRADIAQTAATYMAALTHADIGVFVINAPESLETLAGTLPDDENDRKALNQCLTEGKICGRQTAFWPEASATYFPLSAASGILGALRVLCFNGIMCFSEDEMASLSICASLIASALERSDIAAAAEKSKVEAETEKLRTVLLSSISHDLRTPLASIVGASSTIWGDTTLLPVETVRDLAHSIHVEAERLSHIVTNLLDVTRLECGPVTLNKQPYFIEELIGAALAHLEAVLAQHKVMPHSDGVPLVLADGMLIEQVLTNLLENTARYTPPGTTITITAERAGDEVLVRIADDGPGIAEGHEQKIFDKFYSMERSGARKGTGLGLAICAAIIKAHQGRIWAENRPAGGAVFSFTLPLAQRMTHAAN